jgi:hypothetical protein
MGLTATKQPDDIQTAFTGRLGAATADQIRRSTSADQGAIA